MNRQECIDALIIALQYSEYYESDRGTKESYDEIVKRNLEVLKYLKENLK